MTPLHLAVISDRSTCIAELAKGIRENLDFREVKDLKGETALHKAARYGFVDCAQVLIQTGAYVDALYILIIIKYVALMDFD